MTNSISKKIVEAVETERTSSEYAANYYETEAEMAKLFLLDTQILDKLIPPKKKLFDPMMGRGRHVIYFARKMCDITGNDYNKHMVNLVKEDLKKEKLKAKLHNLDVTNLSAIKDNTFDCVICMFSSFGCIPGSANRQKALQEFARVTKPGGLVVVHTHNRFGCLENPVDSLWLLKTYLYPGQNLETGDDFRKHGPLGSTYLHYFSPSEMRHAFTNSGLSVIQEIYLSRDQGKQYKGPLKGIVSPGFIFVGRKSPAIS